MKPFSGDKTVLLVAGLVGLAAWLWFRLYTGITLEDALITFRYAQNLAQGNGFVFNLGERVLGTTTPLLTLVLGLLGAVLGASTIPVIANVLMFAASLGAGVFTFQGLRALSLSREGAGLVLIGFYLHPSTLWTTAGGMETPLVLFFMALGFWALVTERFTIAAASSALLILTRVDGAIWSAGVLLLIFLRNRRAFLKGLFVSAAIVSPWLLFAEWYFGSFVPSTVIAKRLIGEHAAFSVAAFLEEARWLAKPFCAAAPFAATFGLLLFFCGAVLLSWKRESPILRWLVVYPFLFTLAFYFGRAPRFRWYLVPATWSALIVGILGLHESWRRFGRLSRVGSSMVGLALGAIFFLGFLRADLRVARHDHDYQINEDGTRKALGIWLNRTSAKGAVVAMEAIGYQGYYSRRTVIDLGGLVSPKVVAIHQSSKDNAKAFATICEKLRPDYIVLRSYEFEENIHFHGGKLFDGEEQRKEFDAKYRKVKEFVAPLPAGWGKLSRVTVFQRRRE
jgi:hypothetical protein